MDIPYRDDRSQGLQNISQSLPPFKSERLNANIKLTLHKALTRSVMTYACPAWEFAADTYLLNCSACKTRRSAQLVTFQGALRPASCMWRSKFHTCMIISQNYVGSKHKSNKITTTKMFKNRTRRSQTQKV